eukprot:1157849-Pelagomonas_calceolata.AAC.4
MQVQHTSLLPSHAIARLTAALPMLAASPTTQGAACVLSAPLAKAAASKLHALQHGQVSRESVDIAESG